MVLRSSFVLLTLSLLALGCPGQRPAHAPPAPAAAAEDPLVWKMSKSGLGFRLSNADDEADNPRERPPTPSTPLAAADARKLAARLPELKRDPDDAQEFAMRAKSIPAPRPGTTVTETFPPPDLGRPPPVVAASGPLKIERHAPEGPVDLAPNLQLTFSAPMVAVTSVSDKSLTEHPPVRLIPEPSGQWRWLGSRTLLFQPDKRFPMATEYSVEIPAGTKATTGQTIAAPVKWTFVTPPPALKGKFPTGYSQPLDPLVFAEFDQAIEPKAMLASVELRAGSTTLPIRLAEADEVEANDGVRRLAQHAEKGRWLAFRAAERLHTSTTYDVQVKKGARGAEGPRPTDKDQSFTFTTYGPMQVTHSSCNSWRNGKEACPPLTPFSIGFSNAIDPKHFDKNMVTVSPEIPGVKVEILGGSLTLSGRTKGRTKYTVNLASAIGDVHGQTLTGKSFVTFDVGSAEPTMFGSSQDMIVIDPGQKSKDYRVYSINEPGLRTRIYAVSPADWGKYLAYHHEWERPRKLTPPGRLVFEKTIAPKGTRDELTTTAISLAPALTNGLGQAIVVVEPTHPLPKDYHRPELHVWVQSTELGLDAMIENDQVTGWATRLADGAPLAGVDVQLLGAASAKTDAQGLARVPLGTQPGKLVVGRRDKDVVIVPESYYGEPTYQRVEHGDTVRWLVYDDRGMYKPGEEVHVKGWVRRAAAGRDGDLDGIADIAGKSVHYRIRDPRWAELGTGTAAVDEFGSFDFAFKLPDNANLGSGTVELELGGVNLNNTSSSHRFDVQEFRRPEFEVTARSSEGPHFVGGHAVATLSASYYAGGGLPDAPVEWRVTRSLTSFTPPNRSEYHFGPEPEAFWSWRSRAKDDEKTKTETWSSKTNPLGVHRLRADFDAVEPSYPMKLDLSATVSDVNRQSWAGRTSMVVHPSSAYVGLKLAKNFLRAGENLELDAVVVDVDGKDVAGRQFTVKAARVDWQQKPGSSEYEEKLEEVQTCESKPHCTFKTQQGGSWRVWAIVTDDHDRKNQSTTSLWVMGAERPKDSNVERGKANLVLDKQEYHPGDLAELLVVAPFAPAEALLTVRRQGIVHVERFTMASSSHTIKLKLEESLVPGGEVRVDLVGQGIRDDASGSPDERLPKRPAFAVGSIQAKVLATNRTLGVKAGSAKPAIEPGGKTSIEIAVTDAAGRGVSGAEVAVVVADEAVLALSGYKTPDPISVFYSPRGSDVHDVEMRSHVLLGEPDLSKLQASEPVMANAYGSVRGGGRLLSRAEAAPSKAAPGAPPPPPPAPQPVAAPSEIAQDEDAMVEKRKKADDKPRSGKDSNAPVTGGEGESTKAIQVRTDFSALALFSPKVKTDASGHATVPLKLPDNLTRYRVMAVAATKDRSFGAGESTLTARLPVMVRPSAPRFLNFGDKFELPVVIQNQTDQPLDVGVVARATNATVDEPSAKRVRVPPNDRAEVRFSAATVKPGTARFQLGVSAGGWSDASQVELPVWTPATTEAFATYGTVDEGATAQPVKMPNGVFTQFGGLEVETSSTQLQALTDAVIYLVKYPYECNEQLSSRVISIAALRDVLSAFKSKDLPSPKALEASMKEDMEKLKRRQNNNGGWGFWQEEPWPYLSIHVAHALVRAEEKGYTPDASMMQRSKGYLRSIESHIPGWYPEDARRAIIAYSLYVRNRMKDPDAARAKRLISEAGGVDKLGIEAIGWIWPTLSADKSSSSENEAVRRHVENRVTETAGAAHFVSGYRDADWVLLSSDRRADGVLLEAMIGDQKDSTVIPKLVKGLLAHRKAGHWTNTQENAFVLLALDRYFATYEKTTPDFVARVWLGDRLAGEHAFRGRTTEYSDLAIPMKFLAAEKAKEQNLTIGKEGPGRLYYRVGMQYAPTDLKLPPADYGFVVSRLYEGVDQPDDVKRDPDGTWRVKAGAKVRVRLAMVANSRRYHVALVDKLPAGLEPMNAALAVTGEIPKDPKVTDNAKNRYWYWSRTWYEHQNMRDERVEAFASLLWEGVWDYSYVARATTPGTFVVPPAKAEEMYSPETFGRSAGDKLIVE